MENNKNILIRFKNTWYDHRVASCAENNTKCIEIPALSQLLLYNDNKTVAELQFFHPPTLWIDYKYNYALVVTTIIV